MGVTGDSRFNPLVQIVEWYSMSVNFTDPYVNALLSKRDPKHTEIPLEEHRQLLTKHLRFSPEQIAVPHQVHGINVEIAIGGHLHENTDGLITNDPAVVLSLQVADCVPIYIHHAQTGLRGLVHAGWRGAAAGVVEVAIEKMLKLGANVEGIEVAYGPCIEQSCYEVGPEVRGEFSENLAPPNNVGRFQLDLEAAVTERLTNLGLLPDNIQPSGICSKCDENAHSYRRDGEQSGRMIAFFYDNGEGLR